MINDADVTLEQGQGLVLQNLDQGFDFSLLRLTIQLRDHSDRSLVIPINLLGFLKFFSVSKLGRFGTPVFYSTRPRLGVHLVHVSQSPAGLGRPETYLQCGWLGKVWLA